MRRRADSLTTAVINDQRTITLTGRLIGVIPCGRTVRLDVLLDAADEVDVHERSET